MKLLITDNSGTVLDSMDIEIGGPEGHNLDKPIARQILSMEIIDMLRRASGTLMPRALPTVKIGRKTYFVDERLSEIRNVKRPSDAETVAPELIVFWKQTGKVKHESC